MIIDLKCSHYEAFLVNAYHSSLFANLNQPKNKQPVQCTKINKETFVEYW